jgi:hypothetical protein
MKDSKNDNSTALTERRTLLNGIGALALAGVAVGSATGSAPAAAQETSGKFEPKRHALDAWMDAVPGAHRVVIDSDSTAGGTNALRYATNIINAHINAYEGGEQDMAMIICYRHASTVLGFNDAMWEKYGSIFVSLGRPPGQEAETPVKNPQTDTIAAAAAMGIQFASTMFSGLIARQTNQVAEDVLAELVANKIPNGHMVPAGVMAITRAQEYGYSFMYSAA